VILDLFLFIDTKNISSRWAAAAQLLQQKEEILSNFKQNLSPKELADGPLWVKLYQDQTQENKLLLKHSKICRKDYC
jgi:hypothetical protein